MKANYTFPLVLFLSLSLVAKAQTPIVLVGTDYGPLVGNDTTYHPASNFPFAVLSQGTPNGNWNFSSVGYLPDSYQSDRNAPASPNPYGGSKFSATRIFSFGNGLFYQIQRYYNLTTALLSTPGETVAVRQALPLGSATGGASDSVVFPAQTIAYSSPEKVLQLPATYPAAPWSSVSGSSTLFNLTITALGINNAPGERRSQRSRTDAVVGWGTLVLARANGAGPSGPIPVLQVRSRVVTRDSFFLNGQLASVPLLSAFGLQQGALDTTSRIYLYRMGELTPLVEAIWKGSDTTTAPTEVLLLSQRLPIPFGIEELPQIARSLVLPNPVRRGQTLNFRSRTGAWSATVLNGMGQIVATGQGLGTGTMQTLDLPAALPAGTYFLTVQGEEKTKQTQPFILVD